jgi:hypothetical protein
LLVALVADPLVHVEGTCVCPTPGEVAPQIERLLSAGPSGGPPDRAWLDGGPDGVRLRLTSPDGTLIGERSFARERSCADLAEAVALVVAIWEWPLRPGMVPPPELSLSASGGAPPKRAIDDAALAGARSWRFEVGAAFQEVAPGLVPGVLVEAIIRGAGGRWGARLSLGAASWRDVALGAGRASWSRATGGAGLVREWSGRRLFLDLQAQASMAALVAKGQGFDEDQTRVAFDPGVGLGIRGGAAWAGLFRTWIDVGVTYWPVGQKLRADLGPAGPPGPTADVARFEAALSVGGSFSTFR